MKISEFSYRNILSYGNKLQTIKFDGTPGLVQVSGANGNGKSAIKEALTVSIYGRSAIRKMKDIPNWINRNAFTSIKFTTNRGEEVELTRGIDPNYSDIKINGVQFNLPDKRKVDEFIEDELAKIPFSVFSNTISLSFDDFKSFVNLSKEDKRKIVDRIFGIDILSDMRAQLKKDIQENKKDFDILDSNIALTEVTIENHSDHLTQLKKQLAEKKNELIIQLTEKITKLTSDLANTQNQIVEINNQISSKNNSKSLIESDLNKTKNTIRDLTSKLTTYSKNRCPQCLNDLKSESSLSVKNNIDSKVKELSAALPAQEKELSDINNEISTFTSDKNKLSESYYQIKAELSTSTSLLEASQVDTSSDELISIEKIIDDLRDKLKLDSDRLAELKDTRNLYLTLDDLLSDTGIKKSMIDKIIPTLNKRIFEISERLEFKFPFEFDSDFNPIINYLGMQISPDSLSTGQRKKMNLIVLLAFIEIIKMKHSEMNVMFLDEIFSSLDKANVYMAISILKEYSEKYGMMIFIVSHESLPEELFNYQINVTQQNHFSEMEIIKI